MITIAVIDGQGGGIGSLIVKRLQEGFPGIFEIIALGTNSSATLSMLKARANKGATGENAIVMNCREADIIIGTLSIVLANSMMGELTPAMAAAVAGAKAKKILIPLNQEGVEIIGVSREPFPHLVDALMAQVRKTLEVKDV